MKNTIFKSFKFTFSLMLTVMLCLSFSTITNAASVKDIPVKKTISADITGDGKADKILITTTMDDDFRVKKLKVTVNKKTAFSKNCTDSGINYITAKYAKMTNKNEFIQLMGIGDNDYIVFNQIYKYNNTSKKLYSVSKLDNTACEIVSAKKNRLTLHHGEQPAETGWLTWKMSYKFRNNKLVLTNATTSTVKSTIGYSRKDSYSKLFRKNIFVTAKKLRFYNGKKLAFTVPKGKQVTLKKLTLSKGNIYLQFQYGKKTGWISVNNKNYDFESPYFKKVNSRLAGKILSYLRKDAPLRMK